MLHLERALMYETSILNNLKLFKISQAPRGANCFLQTLLGKLIKVDTTEVKVF